MHTNTPNAILFAVALTVPRIRSAHDTHALSPLASADGTGFLARPVGGFGRCIEERGSRTEELLLFVVGLGLKTALFFFKVGYTRRDVDILVWCGIYFFEEGLELFVFEVLDEVKEVLDRGSGSRACLRRHWCGFDKLVACRMCVVCRMRVCGVWCVWVCVDGACCCFDSWNCSGKFRGSTRKT